MWRAEIDPRTRSTGLVFELLESEPDWERIVLVHQQLTHQVPRLRERVVQPLLPVVAPAWSPDPHFDLGYHLRHVCAPRGGSADELNALAATFIAQPLDLSRPPWEALLVAGLAGGRAAYLLKLHHSLSDGLGTLQLMDLMHEKGPGPTSPNSVPMSALRRAETPASLLVSRLIAQIAAAPGKLLRRSAAGIGRVATHPIGVTANSIGFVSSVRRVLTPPDVRRSPALGAGGTNTRLLTHDVPLAALQAAAKACGGTVNDAFVAALLGAFRRYHDHVGQPVDAIPVRIPISLRTDRDPQGGNKFATAMFAGPVGQPDPRVRMEIVGEVIARARVEPAVGLLGVITWIMSKLPSRMLTGLGSRMLRTADLQASNVGGIEGTLYLAGSRVARVYPVGARPGVAAMITVLSYGGTCCVGMNLDPESITDVPTFATCLREGFDEVLELADPGLRQLFASPVTSAE